MARRNNRKCICCSEEYRYCNSCEEYRLKPIWYNLYHNENCKNIFNTASDYLAGVITKEEAKESFDKCDLSYKDKLHHKIIEAMNNVYDATMAQEEVKKSVVEKPIAKVEETEGKKVHKKKVVFE